MKIIKNIWPCLLLFISSATVFAQEEKPGDQFSENCKDHAFIKRMPGYFLGSCFEVTDPGDIFIDKGNFNFVTLGSRKTEQHYIYAPLDGSGEGEITHGEVLKHFEQTLNKNAVRIYLITQPSLFGPLAAVYKLVVGGSTHYIFIVLNANEGEKLSDKNRSHTIIVASINE